MKKSLSYIIAVFLTSISAIFADISDVIVSPYFNGVSGQHNVEIEFLVSDNSTMVPLIVSGNSQTIVVNNVNFVNGYSEIYLQNLSINNLATKNLIVNAEIPGLSNEIIRFNSVAYAIKSQYAESVLYPYADHLDPSSFFTNPVTVNSSIEIGDIVFSNSLPVISDSLSRTLEYIIDLNSTINVTEGFYLNSQPINKSFSWQHNKADNSLYTLKNIGINMERTPFFNVDVSGTVRADEFLLNNGRLGAFQEWKLEGDNLYFNNTNGNVSLGSTNPLEKLDINGAINLGSSTASALSIGTIVYSDTSNFYGAIVAGTGTKLVTLNTLSSDGRQNRLAIFDDNDSLTYDELLSYGRKSTTQPGIEFISNDVPLRIVKSDNYNGNLFDIYKNSNFVVSMNNSGELSSVKQSSSITDGKLMVGGKVNASKFYLDGAPIEFRLVSGEIFLRSVEDISKTRANIYYNNGNVSIGKFNATSNLEIQAPYTIKDESIATKDAAITFSFVGNNNVKYTLGVDSSAQDKFLIESGAQLGTTQPLMSIRKKYLSIGIDEPRSNLHVSGNNGLLIDGSFGYFDSTFPSQNIVFYQMPGTRFFFNSYNDSFRVGTGTASSRKFENVGFHTVDFGNLNTVKGNFSTNLSGYNNSIDAINAVNLSGHSNVISGEFSMAQGRSASVGFQHDGSFIFSSPFYYGYNFENEFTDIISQDSSFKTAYDRQFLIGSPESSSTRQYLDMSFAVNTNSPSATVDVAGTPIIPLSFQNELNITSKNSKVIFNSLVNQNFISQSESNYGYVLVPRTNYFNDYYSHVTFNLMVSINSNELFKSIVNYAKDNSLNTISSQQLANILPTQNWDSYYFANSDQFSNDNASYFYNLYVNNLTQENATQLLYIIRGTPLIDSNYSKAFSDYCIAQSGGSLQDIAPADGTYDFIANYVNTLVLNDPLAASISTFKKEHLINIIQADVEEIKKEYTTFQCAKLPSKNVTNSDIISFVQQNDINTMTAYSSTSYNDFLKSKIFPDLIGQIYTNIENLDSISLKTFDLNKKYFLDEYKKDFTIQTLSNVDITTANILDVLYSQLESSTMELRGISSQDTIRFLNSGSLSLGYSKVEDANLAISKNIILYPEYQITNYHKNAYDSRLSLLNPSSSTISKNSLLYEPMSILIVNPDDLEVTEVQTITPNFVMDVTGNVGLGVMTTYRPPGQENSTENYKLLVFGGSVVAEGFVDSTTGAEMQGSPPVIIYDQIDSTNFSDGIERMVFVSGNAGIGTTDPGSLLSLSKEVGDNNPIITFDLNNVDMFEVGMKDSDMLQLGNVSSGAGVSALNVLKEGVSFMSASVNTVVGNVLVTDFISVSTSNTSKELMAPILNTTRMFISTNNGFVKVSASGLPWDLDSNGNPYLNDGTKIGIGTAFPTVNLQVTGNLSATKMLVQDNFKLNELYLTQHLALRQIDNLIFKLLVNKNKLLLNNDATADQNVSDTLSRGYSHSGIATLLHTDSLLSSQNSIAVQFDTSVPVNYDLFEYNSTHNVWKSNDTYLNKPANVSINGILKVELANVTGNKLIYSNFSMNDSYSKSLSHVVRLSSVGDYWDDTFSYTPLSYSVTFNKTNTGGALPDKNVEFIGLKYKLSNQASDGKVKTLIDGAKAIGLEVDVSQVKTQDSGNEIRAFKYPAIFMGDVAVGGTVSRDLVGLTEDMPVLEVKGGVQALGFVTPNVIASNTLRFIGGAPLLLANGRFGVGTLSPSVKLQVLGEINARNINSNYLQSDTLSIGNSLFTVDKNGVGFGKEVQDSNNLVYFYKKFTSREDSAFIYKNYILQHEQNHNKDVTLLDIAFSTFSSDTPYRQNFFGEFNGIIPTMKGINLDLSEVSVTPSIGYFTGLNVNVSKINPETYNLSSVSTPNSAVFLNGVVGVGITNPSSGNSLEVNGDLRVKKALISGDFFANPNHATLSNLTVTNNAIFSENVTINKLFVNSLTYDNFDVSNISLSDYSLLVQNTISVENFATINKHASVNIFLSKSDDQLERGFINKYSDGLNSIHDLQTDFDVSANSAVITKFAKVTTINIQNKLFVGQDYFIYNDNDVDFNKKYLSYFKLPLKTITNQLAYTNNDTWNALGLFSNSNTVGSSVGFQLSPHDSSSTSQQSWSILSELTKASSPTTISGTPMDDAGLDLKFINTTYNMVIADTGMVGVNLRAPQSDLHVNGDALFENNVTINNGFLYISTLNFTSNGGFITSASIVGTANFTLVTSNGDLVFATQSKVPTPNNDFLLYYYSVASGQNNGFHFIKETNGNVVSNNLSSTFNITNNQFIFFDSNNKLASIPLNYTNNSVTDISKFAYAVDPNSISTSLLQLKQVIPTDTVFLNDLDIHKTNISVFKRNTTAQNLIGKKISIVSKNISAASVGESFVGLDVDLRGLTYKSTYQYGQTIYSTEGNKYAALLNGGSVIISSVNLSQDLDITIPTRSNLYVYNSDMFINVNSLGNKFYPSMIVEANSDDSNFEWFVSGKGNTSVGTGIVSKNFSSAGALGLTAQLIVSANSINSDLLSLNSASNSLLLSINKDGGLSTISDSNNLGVNVDDIFKSDKIGVTNITTNRILFSQGSTWNFDYSNKFVGLNQSTPIAQLHATDIITQESFGVEEVRKKIFNQLRLNRAVTSNITAYEILFRSADIYNGIETQAGNTATTVTGLKVDVSNLNVDDNSSTYGMYVEMGTRNAFVVADDIAQVGIGVLDPNSALDVDGTIDTTFFKTYGLNPLVKFNVNVVTVNSVFEVLTGNVSGNLIASDFTGVSINTLRFTSAKSLNDISKLTGSITNLKSIFKGVNISKELILDNNTSSVSINIGGTASNVVNNILYLTDSSNSKVASLENMITTGTMKLGSLQSVNDETFINFYTNLDVLNNSVSANRLRANKLAISKRLNNSISNGQLFVSPNNHLFIGNNQITLDRSTSIKGKLAYYNSNNDLSPLESVTVTTNQALSQLTVQATSNIIQSLVDGTSAYGEASRLDPTETEYNFSNISAFIPKRSAKIDTLYGTHLKFNPVNGLAAIQDNYFVGMNVDLGNLISDNNYYFSGSFAGAKGFKYAGIFNGGSVLIVSKNAASLTTSANLFVGHHQELATNISRDPIVIFDSNSQLQSSDFVLNVTGNVGLNISSSNFNAMNSQLSVSTNSSLVQSLFNINSSASSTPLFLVQDSVGLGVDPVGVNNLKVAARMNASTKIRSGTLKTELLNIKDLSLFHIDYQNKRLGLGTTQPNSSFHLEKTINSSTASVVTGNVVNIDFSSGVVDEDVNGLAINLKTNQYNNFGLSDETKKAIGLQVDLSTLSLRPNASVYGIKVDAVRQNNVTYNFVTKGTSKVGINTLTPEYMLDVNGTMKASSLDIVSKNMFLTLDSLVSNQKLFVNSSLNVSGNLILENDKDMIIHDSLTFKSSVTPFEFDEKRQFEGSDLDIQSISIKQQMMVSGNYPTLNIGSGTTHSRNHSFIIHDNNNLGIGFDDLEVITLNILSDLTSDQASIFVSANLITDGTNYVSANKMLSNRLNFLIDPNSVPNNSLYLDNSLLKFKNNSGTLFDVSTLFQSDFFGTIPFYGTNGLTSDLNFRILTSNVSHTNLLYLQRNITDNKATLALSVTINSSTNYNDFSAETVRLAFENRQNSNSGLGYGNKFVGVDILVTDNVEVSNVGQARLDTYVGVSVNLSDLAGDSADSIIVNDESKLIDVSKIAALFNEGQFVIVASDTVSINQLLSTASIPEVEVYVSSNFNSTFANKNGISDFLVSSNIDGQDPSIAFLRVNKQYPNDKLMVDIGDNNDHDYLYLMTVSSNANILEISNKDSQLMFGVFKNDSTNSYYTNIGSRDFYSDFFVKGLDQNQALVSINNTFLVDNGVMISHVTNNFTRSAFVDVRDARYNSFKISEGGTNYLRLPTADTHDSFILSLANNDVDLSNKYKLFVPNSAPIGVGGDLTKLDNSSSGGFLVQAEGLTENILWMGVSENVPQIWYGSNNSDLVIKSLGQDVLYFSSDKKLGLFTENPEANFHINIPDSNKNYMAIRKNKFFMDETGKMGINTTVPSVNLHVKGALRVTSIIAGGGGSKLIVPSVNISHDTDLNTFHYKTVSTEYLKEFAMLDSSSFLNTDVTKNIGGYAIKLRNTLGSDFSNLKVIGLDVDVEGIDALNSADSYAYSGIFFGQNSVSNTLDSKFIIDTGRMTNRISHHYNTSRMKMDCVESATCLPNPNYEYQLQVITKDNSKGTGFISFGTNASRLVGAEFTTYEPYAALGASAQNKKIQYINQASLSILSAGSNYQADRDVSISSFINLFSSKTDLLSNSLAIFDMLTAKGLIDSGTKKTIMGASTAKINVFSDPGVDIPITQGVSSENILARIASFPTQNVFNLVVSYNVFEVSGGSTSFKTLSYFPISISSGILPAYLQQRNLGMVGFNVFMTSNDFESNPGLFDSALVVGSEYAHHAVDPIYYRLPAVDKADTLFTHNNGYVVPYADWMNSSDTNVNRFGAVETDESVNEFVNRDQHSVTKIGSLATTGSEYTYMSYKTRFKDMRLGKYMPKVGQDQTADHVKLFFSGAPCVASDLAENDDCSENNDDLTIGRENSTVVVGSKLYNQSRLFFTLAENGSETDVMLQVGYEKESGDNMLFNAPFIAGGKAVNSKDQSFVGIGNQWVENVTPKAVLHVKDNLKRTQGPSIINYLPTTSDGYSFGQVNPNTNSQIYTYCNTTYPVDVTATNDDNDTCFQYFIQKHAASAPVSSNVGTGCDNTNNTTSNCNYFAFINDTFLLGVDSTTTWSDFVNNKTDYTSNFADKGLVIGDILFSADGSFTKMCTSDNASCTPRSSGVNPSQFITDGSATMNPPTGYVNTPFTTMIENTSDENSDIVALNLASSGTSSDTNDFVGFYINTGSDTAPNYKSVGAIEGSAGTLGGIQFSSPSKDYAEYMLKKDPKEELKPGDVVGVFGGLLSKETQGADNIMVISSSPIIIGNFPGDKFLHLYGLTAFLGQVPVKVIGDVEKGDILVASGQQDGSAIAFKEKDLLPQHLNLIVGRAWENSQPSDNSISYVNTLIGFPFNVHIINSRIGEIKDQINLENKQSQDIKEKFDQQLDKQDELILKLKKALSMIEEK